MSGITQGSAAITGVYVRNRLATGVYAGMTKLWPLVPGVFGLGSGTFQLAPSALQMQIGHGIALPEGNVHFAGQSLAFAANDGIALNIGVGALDTAGSALAVSTAAHATLALGHATFATMPLATRTEAHVALDVGIVMFNDAPLSLSGDITIDVHTSSLTFAGHALTASGGVSGHFDIGMGAFAFMAAAPVMSASLALAMDAGTCAVTDTALGVSANATANMDADVLTMVGQTPIITANMSVSEAIGAGVCAIAKQTPTITTGTGIVAAIGAPALALSGEALAVTVGSGGGIATRIAAQPKTGTTSISSLVFDPVDIQPGDLLIAKWSSPFNRFIGSVTDSGSGGTWAPAVVYSDYSGVAQGFDQIYYAIATSAKTGCVVTEHLNGSIDTYGGWLEVYRPPTGKTFTFVNSAKQLVADTAQTPNPLPCSPITLSGNVLLSMLVGNARDGSPVVVNSFDHGDVINSILNAKGSSSVGMSGQYIGTNLSSLVINASFGSNNSGDNWALKDFLIAPFTYA